jgi:uncharacterized integral membrane protein (TIGR00698 family)
MELRETPVTPSSPYSWAEYLAYLEGVPEDIVSAGKQLSSTSAASMSWGLLSCLGLTLVAMWMNELPFWPFIQSNGHRALEPVMLAIIMGMISGNVWTIPKSLYPGIKASVKKLLPLGIILLGARLNFLDIMRLGSVGVLMSCLEVCLALALMWFFTRQFGVSTKLGALLGVGTAICGGTAIVATAPVIEAEESDVVFGVATVTLLGLLGMFLLPIIAHAMDLTSRAFGVWAGLAIHQTPQVIAAGFAYSQQAGETATIVKMARVCLLAPVVFVIGFVYARSKAQKEQSAGRKQINYFSLFPKFVFGFLALALVRTLGWLPNFTIHLPQAAVVGHVEREFSMTAATQWGANFCIVMSMAGVGLETRFTAMKKSGVKPFVVAALSAIVITFAVLGLIRLLKIS